MTAIAFKKENDFIHLAADSRETAQTDIILTDNAQKIYEEDNYIFTACGDSRQILRLNHYLKNNIHDENPDLDLEELIYDFLSDYGQTELNADVMLILKKDWNVYRAIDDILIPLNENYYAIGSGFQFCMGALSAGASVLQAVKIACEHHSHCGGIIEARCWEIK